MKLEMKSVMGLYFIIQIREWHYESIVLKASMPLSSLNFRFWHHSKPADFLPDYSLPLIKLSCRDVYEHVVEIKYKKISPIFKGDRTLLIFNRASRCRNLLQQQRIW